MFPNNKYVLFVAVSGWTSINLWYALNPLLNYVKNNSSIVHMTYALHLITNSDVASRAKQVAGGHRNLG